jgi:integrase
LCRPKVRKIERFLSDAEIASLARSLRTYEVEGGNPYISNAIRLLLLTGCRKNELLTLQWDQVDLDRAHAFLADSKTGRKPVYLNAPALKIISRLPRVEGNPYVIVGERSGFHLVNIDKAWREIRAAAGMPSLRFHDLRHSYASVGAAGGMSLPIIGALLGHKEASTTARYAHLSADPLRAAARQSNTRVSDNQPYISWWNMPCFRKCLSSPKPPKAVAA